MSSAPVLSLRGSRAGSFLHRVALAVAARSRGERGRSTAVHEKAFRLEHRLQHCPEIVVAFD